MADVIDFEERKGSRKKREGELNLNEFIKEAKIVCEGKLGFQEGEIAVLTKEQLLGQIEQQIFSDIFRKKLISSDIFFCGKYVSALLFRLVSETPESWYAIDYHLKSINSPFWSLRAGDACFVICGVFPERANRRSMSFESYQEMGRGYYSQYYSRTGREIGHHMSRHFGIMAQISYSAIHFGQ